MLRRRGEDQVVGGGGDETAGELAREAGCLDDGALLRPESTREERRKSVEPPIGVDPGRRRRHGPQHFRESAEQKRLTKSQHPGQLTEQPLDQSRTEIADVEKILGVTTPVTRHVLRQNITSNENVNKNHQ